MATVDWKPQVALVGSSHAVRGNGFMERMREIGSNASTEEHITFFANMLTMANGGTSSTNYEWYLFAKDGDKRDDIPDKEAIAYAVVFIGSNDLDTRYRTHWKNIPDYMVPHMADGIQHAADEISTSVLQFIAWVQNILPLARLVWSSITERGYWNDYTDRVRKKVNIQVQKEKTAVCMRTYEAIPTGHPPWTKPADLTHYTDRAYHALFKKIRKTIRCMERAAIDEAAAEAAAQKAKDRDEGSHS